MNHLSVGFGDRGDNARWYAKSIVGDSLVHGGHLQQGEGEALTDGEVGEAASLPLASGGNDACALPC